MHLSGMPVSVDDDQRFGILRYSAFDQGGIDIHRYGLAVDKLYRCSGIFNRLRSCDHVNAGTTTSSLGPMPSAARTRCSATVPLAHATAYSQPASWAKARSNLSTKGPFDEIQ